jgi:hypothetical protein
LLSSTDQEKTMRFKRFLLISLFYGLFFFLLLNPTQVNGAESRNISGFVFIDHNENGLKDAGEPGLPNVVVSNQREVVLTDKEGRYSLPVREHMIIFVSKPAGFELPRNEHNLPQFYYIHRPEGSPDGLKYPGIAPTGKLPDEINFPLNTAPYKENFKALISGDPQPRDSVEVGYFRDDIITEMIGSDADFYLALGDIAYDDLSIYDQYNRTVSQIGLPAFHVAGNHDINFRVDSDTFSLETFTRIYGPEYYSFNYGRVHFVVLDNVEYLGWDSENQRSKGYRGSISEEQLLWLENDLRHVPDDFLIVLSMHIPLYTKISPGASVNVANRDALFRLLAESSASAGFIRAHAHSGASLPGQGAGLAGGAGIIYHESGCSLRSLVERPQRPPRHSGKLLPGRHTERLFCIFIPGKPLQLSLCTGPTITPITNCGSVRPLVYFIDPPWIRPKSSSTCSMPILKHGYSSS